MRFKNLLNYKTLGVINMTPNSFSDHGASLKPEHFSQQLNSFLADPTIIIDVGFESTAPMNQAISFEEELARFELFLTASKDYSFINRFISFDTYKIQNFKIMREKFLAIHPKAHVIFNDVSGVLNEELKELLRSIHDEEFYYIYTFTHIPERSRVLEHMKFINLESDVIEQVSAGFKEAYEWFKSFGMENQLIFDPGFGFSKSYEQNWRLINSFKLLDEKIQEFAPDNTCLIGLSKKSFLKKALASEGKSEDQLEDLHSSCINIIKNQAKTKLLFRVHDPKIMK